MWVGVWDECFRLGGMEEKERHRHLPLLAGKERRPNIVETGDTATGIVNILWIDRGIGSQLARTGIGLHERRLSDVGEGGGAPLQWQLKAVAEDWNGKVQGAVGEVC